MELARLEQELQRGAAQAEDQLPELVRLRVDETLASLPDLKPSKRMNSAYAAGITAAALCIVVLGSAFYIPEAAAALRQLPGISSVFALAGDYGLRAADEKGLVTAIEQSSTDRGITLQVKEVMYDGSRISIGYLQQSNGPIEEITRGIEFYIDGKRFTSPLSGNGSSVDEHTYAGVIHLLPEEELPSRFTLQMDVKQIGTTQGRWSFTLPVTRIVSSNKAVLPMVTKSAEGITLTVKKLTFTPGTTQLDVEVKQAADDKRFLQYDLFDEKGVQLQRRSGGGGGHTDGMVSLSTFSQHFGPASPLPSSITVRPFVDGPSSYPSKETRAPLVELPTEEKPMILSQGEAGHMYITRVERLADKTRVHYRTEGLIPHEQGNPLWIEDHSGKKHLNLQKATVVVDPTQYRFIREFPAFPESEGLTLVTRELKPPGYLEELEMTVPIQP